MIRRNEGTVDRLIRAVLGVLMLVSGIGVPAVGWGVQLLGAVLLATAIAGWCPLYSLLHLSTIRRKNA